MGVLVTTVTRVELGTAATEDVLGMRATDEEDTGAGALLGPGVWVRVTGQTVVNWVSVEVITVVEWAGQSVTVAAHEVIVISVVLMTVEVLIEVMIVGVAGGEVVEGVA